MNIYIYVHRTPTIHIIAKCTVPHKASFPVFKGINMQNMSRLPLIKAWHVPIKTLAYAKLSLKPFNFCNLGGWAAVSKSIYIYSIFYSRT